MKILPAIRPAQIRAQRSLADQHRLHCMLLEIGRLHNRPPQVGLDDQEFRLAVRQELQVLGRGQLEVQGNQHASAEKNGICRHQPLRLVAHDDGGAVAFAKIRVLQRARQRTRQLLEIGVGKARLLLVAIGLDQASLIRPMLQRIAQSGPQRRILAQI